MSLAVTGAALGAEVVGLRVDDGLRRPQTREVSAGDLYADLVYAAGGSIVDTTVVAGEVLMRDRKVDDARGDRRRGRRASPTAHRPIASAA